MRIRLLHSGPSCLHAIGVIATSALLAFVSYPVHAAPADGPFAAFQGSWSGTGTIVLSSGAKERIRCRANHRLGSSSAELRLALNCNSDSYKFDLQSQVTNSAGTVSGNWSESTRLVGGTISNGRAAGNQIRVRAEGQAFTAILSITTRGNRQSISIQSPGSEMSNVAITLTRKSR
jgi:hypothetical protein